MKHTLSVTALVTLASICLTSGIAILSSERRF